MGDLTLGIIAAAVLFLSGWVLDTYFIRGDRGREKLRPVWKKVRSLWDRVLVYFARFVALTIFVVLYAYSVRFVQLVGVSANPPHRSSFPVGAPPVVLSVLAIGLASLAALVLYAVFFWAEDTRISRRRLKDRQRVARLNTSVGLTLVVYGILLLLSAMQAAQNQLLGIVLGNVVIDYYLVSATVGAGGCFIAAVAVFLRVEDAPHISTAVGVLLSVISLPGLILALWVWWFVWSDAARAYYADGGNEEVNEAT